MLNEGGRTQALSTDFPWVTANHGYSYLDNGATTQKHHAVIDRITAFLSAEYATVHRGVYRHSMAATEACEQVRHAFQTFINAPHAHEVIFTTGTTMGLNTAAFGMANQLKSGDEIVLTEMEHHANWVPWQQVAQRTGAVIKVVPITPVGELDYEWMATHLTERTAVVSVMHVSNVLGTINDIPRIVAMARQVGAKVVVDGAQAIAHIPVDVQALGVDAYVVSGHKMYGPTGVGVLWGKTDWLSTLSPFVYGGDMIETVTVSGSTFCGLPGRLEGGTPPIAEIVGLGPAIGFLQGVGWPRIMAHDEALRLEATTRLKGLDGISIYGESSTKTGVISFGVAGVHPHDVGSILDECQVAVRVGHHCAQPLMTVLGVPATVRASFGVYNSSQDIDRLVAGLEQVMAVFR